MRPSHAQMYAPVWTSIIAGRGHTGLLVPVNGCLPTVQANISRDCMQIARDNLAEISKLARVRAVIIGLSWVHKQGELIDASGRPVDDIDNRALISVLDDLIDRLQRMGTQVVLIGPIAEVQCPDERCYFVLDGRSLFADSNHVASAELPRFRAMFEAALGAQPPR